MKKLKEADWIALRLLYIIMSSDPSSSRLPDVRKAIDHYGEKLRPRGARKYVKGSLLPVFALLNKEIPYDGETFTNPGVRLTRDVKINLHEARQEEDRI